LVKLVIIYNIIHYNTDLFVGICCNWRLQRSCWIGSEVFKGSRYCHSRCNHPCKVVNCARSPWLLGQQNWQATHCSL